MQTPKLQTYREIYPHPLNPPTCDENFRTWKMAGRSRGRRKRAEGGGEWRAEAERRRVRRPSAVPPTLIHFPPYLAANYEEGGNKKRAGPLLFSPLLAPSPFCLVRFAAQHDIAERRHEWRSEEGCCVGQGRLVGQTASARPISVVAGYLGLAAAR